MGGAGGADGVVSDVEVRQVRHAVEVAGEVQRAGWSDLVVPGAMRSGSLSLGRAYEMRR